MFERTWYGGTCFVSVSVSLDESAFPIFKLKIALLQIIHVRALYIQLFGMCMCAFSCSVRVLYFIIVV